jgi:hypothetical protein
MMLGSPALASVDLRNWKVIIGGSALPVPLAPRRCRSAAST